MQLIIVVLRIIPSSGDFKLTETVTECTVLKYQNIQLSVTLIHCFPIKVRLKFKSI